MRLTVDISNDPIRSVTGTIFSLVISDHWRVWLEHVKLLKPKTINSYSEVNPVSVQAIREYLAKLWRKYQVSSRRERSIILDEMERNLGYHRKAAIRTMNYPYPPRSLQGFRGGRAKTYSEQARFHLSRLWRIMGYMGAKRMKYALPEWIEFYEHKDFNVSIKNEVLRMSENSIFRFLAEDRCKLRRKRNSGTRRALKKYITQIPIRNLEEQPSEVGHCEIDCVAHCGGSLSGEFAWSLTLTDIASGWTECESLWGKTGYNVRSALKNIERRLPFKLKVLYSDNGSEFLNKEVIEKFVRDRKIPLDYFRGRPYRKNDQCHVEQKNYTHVRQLFGYGRIDWKKSVSMMNNIYRKEWRLLQNFFIPQQKLIAKYRENSKIIRKMDTPKTPYDRLQKLMPEEMQKLSSIKKPLNPIRLRQSQLQKTRDCMGYYKNSIAKSELGKMAI